MNNLQEAIEHRISRRSFKNQTINDDMIHKIMNMIETVNNESGLTSCFIRDGSNAFHSIKKSYGMFKNVTSLIVLKGNRKEIHLKEKIGYYGEQMVLELINMGLGTCWVGGTYDAKKLIPITSKEELLCVIVVGCIEENQSTKEKLLRGIAHHKVKPIEERLINDKEVPKWMIKGMKNVLLAPSAIHAQKTMFTYNNDCLLATTVETSKFDLIDLGIAKKHFEIGAIGKFDLGNGAKFHKE